MARSSDVGCGGVIILCVVGVWALYQTGVLGYRAAESPCPPVEAVVKGQVGGLGDHVDADMRPIVEEVLTKWRGAVAFNKCQIRDWKRVQTSQGETLMIVYRIADNLSHNLVRHGALRQAYDVAREVGTHAPAGTPDHIVIAGGFPIKDRLGDYRWQTTISYIFRLTDLRVANWENLLPEDLARLATARHEDWDQ